MAYVVSRNYNNWREETYRWLIRRQDEPIEKARACRSVVASGIEFCESRDGEAGFGCRLVAVAQSAEGSGFQAEELTFDGRNFIHPTQEDYVTSCRRLFLMEDGRILASGINEK